MGVSLSRSYVEASERRGREIRETLSPGARRVAEEIRRLMKDSCTAPYEIVEDR